MKKMIKILSLVFLMITAIIYYFSGPWQPRALRPNLIDIISAGENSNIAIIGLNDNGDIEDTNATEKRVLTQIDRQKPKVVFIFVHGWKHDGSKENLKNGIVWKR